MHYLDYDTAFNQEKQIMKEDDKQEVKPTLEELERLKQFRDDHESDFIENNVRFNNRSDDIRREIERLNEKIAEEISNHQDLQHSDFIDHENDEFMIGHEDSIYVGRDS